MHVEREVAYVHEWLDRCVSGITLRVTRQTTGFREALIQVK